VDLALCGSFRGDRWRCRIAGRKAAGDRASLVNGLGRFDDTRVVAEAHCPTNRLFNVADDERDLRAPAGEPFDALRGPSQSARYRDGDHGRELDGHFDGSIAFEEPQGIFGVVRGWHVARAKCAGPLDRPTDAKLRGYPAYAQRLGSAYRG
jgi:hypothetical protein